jgi:tetratricopeptide (TPR) repeat protein
LARLRAADHDPDQASALLREVLAVSPRHAGALAARAEVEILRGSADAAVRDLRTALAAAGGRSDDLVAIAGGLSAAGLPDDAIAAARRALATGDHSPPARYALAFALSKAERYPESVEEYASLIRDHPAYLPPYRNLGALMARDGELERAIHLWESGLQISPDDPGLLANVEQARRALGLGTLGGGQ